MDEAAPSPVAIARSGDGPRSMVLIHGVGTNRSIWSRAIGTLERGRTVVAVDLPGFGDSPAPESGWRIEAVAAEIATGARRRARSALRHRRLLTRRRRGAGARGLPAPSSSTASCSARRPASGRSLARCRSPPEL